MAIGDLIRLTVNQELDASVVQNVLYYKINEENVGGDDVKTLTESFIAGILTSPWKATVNQSVMFTCVTGQKVFPTPIGAARDFPAGFAGTLTGTSLPATNCALIQKVNLTQGGVGKKGRVYIAGFEEDDTAQGRLDAGAFTRLGTLATSLQADVAGAPDGIYEPVWAVRSPTTPFAITGSVEDLVFNALPRLATQRRRRTPVAAITLLP